MLQVACQAATPASPPDASADERDQLVHELESLAEIVTATRARALRGFISEEMGGGWLPKSREEILELLDALRGGSG